MNFIRKLNRGNVFFQVTVLKFDDLLGEWKLAKCKKQNSAHNLKN